MLKSFSLNLQTKVWAKKGNYEVLTINIEIAADSPISRHASNKNRKPIAFKYTLLRSRLVKQFSLHGEVTSFDKHLRAISRRKLSKSIITGPVRMMKLDESKPASSNTDYDMPSASNSFMKTWVFRKPKRFSSKYSLSNISNASIFQIFIMTILAFSGN